MRDYTSANAKRAKQAWPQERLEGTLFLECAGGAGPGLIDCEAAKPPVDVLCTCGIALSQDRLLPRHGPCALVGRVLESRHTAGEPDLRRVFMGADNAPRVANLAGRGDASTAGDVAAGQDRGIARVAG
jgi:hypothetical protein